MTSAKTYNRIKDVGFALREARLEGVDPTRIQLQKFVYLLDALSSIFWMLGPKCGHKTYHNGPYDPAIQNAVDSMAFRGLVDVTGIWRVANGNRATQYRLTEAGTSFVEAVSSDERFAEDSELSRLMGIELSKYGWGRIVKLVYAEPTFLSAKAKSFGIQIHPEDGLTGSSSFVISLVRRYVKSLADAELVSHEWLVAYFFEFLDHYDRNFSPPN